MFQIGDHVRIKEDANEIKSAQCHFAQAMERYLGCESFVCGLPEHNLYALNNFKCGGANYGEFRDYYWFDEKWLEPVEDIDFSLEEDEIIEMIKKEK